MNICFTKIIHQHHRTQKITAALQVKTPKKLTARVSQKSNVPIYYGVSVFPAEHCTLLKHVLVKLAFSLKLDEIVTNIVNAHPILLPNSNPRHLVKKSGVPEIVEIETANMITTISSSMRIQLKNRTQLSPKNPILHEIKMILQLMP
jgi:hypothetical protein